MPIPGLHKPAVVSCLLLAAVFIFCCPAIASGQDETQTLTLTLGDYSFTPQDINVQAGRAVILTLINKDGITPHNFSLQDSAGGLDIDASVSAGSTVAIEFTPEIPGSYTFFCNKKLPFMKSHRARGMEGTLNILPAAPE